MALRLAACFETTPESWLNLQLTYDLRKAEIERGQAIKAQVQRIAHCALCLSTRRVKRSTLWLSP